MMGVMVACDSHMMLYDGVMVACDSHMILYDGRNGQYFTQSNDKAT